MVAPRWWRRARPCGLGCLRRRAPEARANAWPSLDPDADRRKRLVTVAVARTVTLPAFDAARLKRERAAELMSLDRIDVSPAKPLAPPRELRGGPWLTAHVRGQEAARLRSFWDRPLK
jgi:hypothetical protein